MSDPLEIAANIILKKPKKLSEDDEESLDDKLLEMYPEYGDLSLKKFNRIPIRTKAVMILKKFYKDDDTFPNILALNYLEQLKKQKINRIKQAKVREREREQRELVENREGLPTCVQASKKVWNQGLMGAVLNPDLIGYECLVHRRLYERMIQNIEEDARYVLKITTFNNLVSYSRITGFHEREDVNLIEISLNIATQLNYNIHQRVQVKLCRNFPDLSRVVFKVYGTEKENIIDQEKLSQIIESLPAISLGMLVTVENHTLLVRRLVGGQERSVYSAAAPLGMSEIPYEIIFEKEHILSKIAERSSCGYCKHHMPSFFCGGCKKTLYCSSLCQELDYLNHFKLCKNNGGGRKRGRDPEEEGLQGYGQRPNPVKMCKPEMRPTQFTETLYKDFARNPRFLYLLVKDMTEDKFYDRVMCSENFRRYILTSKQFWALMTQRVGQKKVDELKRMIR